MKKRFAVLITILLLLLLTMAFVACNQDEPPTQREPQPGEWASNNTHHWIVPERSEGDEFVWSSEYPHEFNDENVCSVCGHVVFTDGQFLYGKTNDGYCIVRTTSNIDTNRLVIPKTFNYESVKSVKSLEGPKIGEVKSIYFHKEINEISLFALGYPQRFDTSMQYAEVEEGNEGLWSVDGIIYTHSRDDFYAVKYVPLAYEGELNIIEGTLVASGFAFSNCTKITKIVLPSTISSFQFSGCTSLKDVVIPEGVLHLGKNAFAGCTALKTIKLPKSLLTIGPNAFENSGIETLTLHEKFRSIYQDAFKGCVNFKEIHFEGLKNWQAEYISGQENEVIDLDSALVNNPEVFAKYLVENGKYTYNTIQAN